MATLEVRHGEVFIILTDNCCEHCADGVSLERSEPCAESNDS